MQGYVKKRAPSRPGRIKVNRRRYRLGVVDDHPIMRSAILATFAADNSFKIVGEGSNAGDAIVIAENKAPDLMILDLAIPGNGLTAIRHISRKLPNIKILVLSAHDDNRSVSETLMAGATGYILKGIAGEELIELARSTMKGYSHMPSELAARVMTINTLQVRQLAVNESSALVLSSFEREIVALMGDGYCDRDIATFLGITDREVNTQVLKLCSQLGLRTREELTMRALEWFVPPLTPKRMWH